MHKLRKDVCAEYEKDSLTRGLSRRHTQHAILTLAKLNCLLPICPHETKTIVLFSVF